MRPWLADWICSMLGGKAQTYIFATVLHNRINNVRFPLGKTEEKNFLDGVNITANRVIC